MTAVVLHFSATVPAGRNRQSEAIERLGLPSRVVEQGIMGRIQLLSSTICPLHSQSDPVPEGRKVVQYIPKLDRQFRYGIDENGTARL